MVRIFVPDVPEFATLVSAAAAMETCRVVAHGAGYHRIESDGPVVFERKALGVKPAIWYGLFTGGVDGRITQFDRDLVRIEPIAAASA